jgi:mono/diheme cytochrome c family protein
MKKALIALVIIFVGIQFIPVERTNPPVKSEVDAPPEVKAIFKRACYDCHSNETKWLWYSKVAPVSFLISDDVKTGRRHLNFSEWNVNKEAKAKDEIWDMIRNEEMPPWKYKIMHSEAKLTQEDKNIIRNWAESK